MMRHEPFNYETRGFAYKPFNGLFWNGALLILSGLLGLAYPFVLVWMVAVLLIGAGIALMRTARCADKVVRGEIFDTGFKPSAFF